MKRPLFAGLMLAVAAGGVLVGLFAAGYFSTLCGCGMVNPQPAGYEMVNMMSYSWNPNANGSTYNVTLDLRDTATAQISLVSYYVYDSQNDRYARTAWQNDTGYNHPGSPTMNPNAVVPVIVTIGTGAAGGPGGQCGLSCALAGNPFSFTSNYSYRIVVVTSRNNQFTFTVTR